MTAEASRVANGTPGTSRTQFEYHWSTLQSLCCVQTNNILQQGSINLQIQLTPQINQNATTVWAQTHTHTHVTSAGQTGRIFAPFVVCGIAQLVPAEKQQNMMTFIVDVRFHLLYSTSQHHGWCLHRPRAFISTVTRI